MDYDYEGTVFAVAPLNLKPMCGGCCGGPYHSSTLRCSDAGEPAVKQCHDFSGSNSACTMRANVPAFKSSQWRCVTAQTGNLRGLQPASLAARALEANPQSQEHLANIQGGARQEDRMSHKSRAANGGTDRREARRTKRVTTRRHSTTQVTCILHQAPI